MSESRKVALVVGANGVIGGNLIDHLLTLDDWEIIGLSRRGGVSTDRLRYIAVDLLDREATRVQLADLRNVTHVFYAAFQDRPSWAELVPPNLAMLVNVVDAIEPVAEGLSHISLMQGYKVYGAHLGPFKTPAREDDAGHMPPEFNIDQQAFLERRQIGKSWSWSALRPSVVIGFGLGNPMNLAMVIAIYASMSKELGLPLRFPGKPGAYDSLLEMTDAGLLARATVWAATTPSCANQALNITNGDLFRWNEMWPRIASYFELDVAPPLPMSLSSIMADKEPLWSDMVARYGLANNSYAAVSSWSFGDAVFGWNYDFFADGSKARRLGFHEYVDTAAMFLVLSTTCGGEGSSTTEFPVGWRPAGELRCGRAEAALRPSSSRQWFYLAYGQLVGAQISSCRGVGPVPPEVAYGVVTAGIGSTMVFFVPRTSPLSLDALSEILRGLHLDGATFARSKLGADFRMEISASEGARFYFVAHGTCWIWTTASGWLELGVNDAALVPHGAEHRIAATPGGEGGREGTVLFSGTLRYGSATVHPLAQLMPQVVRACRFGERDPFVAGLLDEMGREAEQLRVGGATVLARLADVLAAKLVRSWVEGACGSSQGWLAAVRDPQIGRAIAEVHRDPSVDWTVAELARIAGISRSKFIERFSALLGEGPAHYVARWRMHLAMQWLGANSVTVAQAASHLGYESDASFSRAFKRVVGSSPAHWRQERRRADHQVVS